MREEPSGTATRVSTDRVVFGIAGVLVAFFLAWGIVSPATLGQIAADVLNWAVADIGWGFSLAATGFVVFIGWLALSRYGEIPLGADGEKPEFHTLSWIAMMFIAGMGIGLMFFGVAEPLAHYVHVPPDVPLGTGDVAVRTAMATSLFHWTLHPWAIYSVVGLAMGYGSFRRGRSQMISAAFIPLLGNRRGASTLRKIIDVLALVATLFGSAASLGIGTLQISSGMRSAGWIGQVGAPVLVVIIAVLTVGFVGSAVSGVARGIQWLSGINVVLAGLLALFVLVTGPTVFILSLVPTAIGNYVADFATMAARSGNTGNIDLDKWLSAWTIFYWAWWISWAPFVGTFLARISRGRTIREFVGAVLLVPSAVSVVWFAIFGGTAIDLQRGGIDVAGSGGEETQIFSVIHTLPIPAVITVLVIVLVAIFFITGADSASLVMGKFSQHGTITPRRWMIVFWGVATGAVAAIMLISGGDHALEGIQNLTFIASVPFAVIMVLMCLSLRRDLREDPLIHRRKRAEELLAALVEEDKHKPDADQ